VRLKFINKAADVWDALDFWIDKAMDQYKSEKQQRNHEEAEQTVGGSLLLERNEQKKSQDKYRDELNSRELENVCLSQSTTDSVTKKEQTLLVDL
jgi:hypothetical protein